MGLMDKLKNMMNIQDEDDFDEDQIDFSRSNSSDDSFDYESVSERKSSEPKRQSKYVNIHATTQLQVVLVTPENFQEVTSIADHLNNKRTVVLNLESADRENSRRLIDFLSGVAYANNGNLKRVAAKTFIITPYNVDVMGELLLDELENNGLYI